MIILDTNVISALMQERRDRLVDSWLDRQPESSIWTTSINVFEVRYGLEMLPAGKKRDQLKLVFESAMREILAGRVSAFDEAAAQRASEIMESSVRIGRTMDMRDAMIAGTALARRAHLATRKERHFLHAGLKIINPWRIKPGEIAE